MTEFHFLRPLALLLLLALPPLLFVLKRQQQQNSYWSGLIPSHLQQAMLHQQDTTKPAKLAWPLSTLVLMIVAFAGPTWEKQSVPLFQVQQGRVLLMDLSASMWATDLKPNRLTHARYKAQDLLGLIEEGELGLVAFAGDAFTLAPLTSDRSTIANLIPVLAPELMPVLGSNLPAGLAAANQLLRDAGYQQGEIILVSDDIVPEHLSQALKLAEQQPWRINILAVGSAAGAPMSKPDGELIRNLDGSVALAQTNYDSMQKLANASGGKLVPYRSDNADLEALLSGLSLDDEASENAKESHQLWLDRGGYLLLLVLPLLALTLRRHSLLALSPLAMPLLVSLLLAPQPVTAGVWQTDDQQGQQLFEQQQFSDAAQSFDDPAWRGSAHYRAGEYEQALEAFNQAEGVDALYNQGNALAQLGKNEQAIERYQQVLEQQPKHQGAAANKALLEQMQQQQQQQSGEGSDGQQDQQEQDKQEQEQQQNESKKGEQQADKQQSGDGQKNQEQSQDQQQEQNHHQDSKQNESQQPEDSEQQQQNDQQTQPEQSQDEQGAQQQSAAQQSEQGDQDEQSPEQQGQQPTSAHQGELTDEEQQQLEMMLNQVQDDPSLLLRNKMEREYLRRRQQGELNREQTQW